MTKELQDLVWSILPKEFKEEVKKIFYTHENNEIKTYLIHLFGHHNLTSDAEGEEMLTVSRKKVQRRHHMAYKCKHSGLLSHDDVQFWKGWQGALDDLFGSKCLPDETKDDTKEPTPTEPKFHVGDWVRAVSTDKHGHIGQITKVEYEYGCNYYQVSGAEGWHFLGKNLEPYTEPEKNIAKNRNLSQSCDKLFDNILKNSFSKERRLNIAAQMMQGLICAPLVPGIDPNPPAECLAQTAFRLADALIAEAEKGGDK